MTGLAVAQATNTKTAVVYFSATGTTERMAKDTTFRGGKDFTRARGDDVRRYVEGLEMAGNMENQMLFPTFSAKAQNCAILVL